MYDRRSFAYIRELRVQYTCTRVRLNVYSGGVPIKAFLYRRRRTECAGDETARQINTNNEQANGRLSQRTRANRKIRRYKNGNSLALAMYRLEFQIAVTARLAVFLSINYTGITLRIMERDAALCGGNNLLAHLSGARSLEKEENRLKMQRRQ